MTLLNPHALHPATLLASVLLSLYLSALCLCCHYMENMLCALLAASIQHRAIIASIGTDAYSKIL